MIVIRTERFQRAVGAEHAAATGVRRGRIGGHELRFFELPAVVERDGDVVGVEHDAAAQRIRDNGLPLWLADRLMVGR